MVLALEVSRLARSSADWHHLLDLCAMTATLIADAEGVYSPADLNDRLLFGLKGDDVGAERGELRLAQPVGLDRDEDERIVLWPDEQIRHAIEFVFALWGRLGSTRRHRTGRRGSEAAAPHGRSAPHPRARASYGAVHDFLTNPAYAGAFVLGRKRQEKRLDAEGNVTVRTVEVAMEEWSVCIPRPPSRYVSREEYLATRKRPRANVRPRGEDGAAAREGGARRRAHLDLDIGPAPSGVAHLVEQRLVGGVGESQVLGERASVRGDDGTGHQLHGGDLALAGS